MIILSIKTDNPIAEIALFDNDKLLDSISWEAHRQLADTIHRTIQTLLERNKLSWDRLQGIGIFKGPGSFTGLRIGMSVTNALALSLGIPVVSVAGKDWQNECIRRLLNHENEKVVVPEYGGDVFTTKPKK